jgi:small GTP-binding protein
MKVYKTELLRNVALVGHGQSGKTLLAEVALYQAGVIDRLGSVEEGTTISDSDPEEIQRKTSISLAFLPFEWDARKINLIDTPGYADFGGEVAAGLRVADGVVVVVDAGSGVEVQTERYSDEAAERGLPRLVAISKLDREYIDFARTLGEVRESLRCNAVAVTIPIGSQAELRGVVDLVKGVAYTSSDGKESEAPIPQDMAGAVAQYREKLIEAAAEADDELMEKYLEEETLSPQEIVRRQYPCAERDASGEGREPAQQPGGGAARNLRGADERARLQDDRRPVRRSAELLPGVLRGPAQRLAGLQLHPRRARAGGNALRPCGEEAGSGAGRARWGHRPGGEAPHHHHGRYALR